MYLVVNNENCVNLERMLHCDWSGIFLINGDGTPIAMVINDLKGNC